MMALLVLWACAQPQARRDEGEPAAEVPAGVQALRVARREALRRSLGPASQAEVGGLFEADAAAGEALYLERCAPCHGVDGAGGGPGAPGPMVALGQAGTFFSNAERIALLREGWPEAGHVPLAGELGEAELLQLAAWVLRLSEPAPQPGGEARGRIR